MCVTECIWSWTYFHLLPMNQLGGSTAVLPLRLHQGTKSGTLSRKILSIPAVWQHYVLMLNELPDILQCVSPQTWGVSSGHKVSSTITTKNKNGLSTCLLTGYIRSTELTGTRNSNMTWGQSDRRGSLGKLCFSLAALCMATMGQRGVNGRRVNKQERRKKTRWQISGESS